MKNFISNSISYVYKFLHRNRLKNIENGKISVHYRRDLDALGEYIKI